MRWSILGGFNAHSHIYTYIMHDVCLYVYVCVCVTVSNIDVSGVLSYLQVASVNVDVCV